jgi:type II secretory ATPase GspE/PulE/Tfp pilus assembly ATPase PilB-like protein
MRIDVQRHKGDSVGFRHALCTHNGIGILSAPTGKLTLTAGDKRRVIRVRVDARLASVKLNGIYMQHLISPVCLECTLEHASKQEPNDAINSDQERAKDQPAQKP